MNSLKPSELTTLQSDLQSLLDELIIQYELGKSATDTVVLDQSKVGRISRMDAMQQQKMAESNMQHTVQRIKNVKLALNKFEEGAYSFCDECGNSIAFERLKIQPEAALCIECQSELELDTNRT
jgi:DnaK suppressor protein